MAGSSPLITGSQELVAEGSELDLLARKGFKKRPFINNVGASKMRMEVLLGGIFIRNDQMVIQLRVRNDSEIRFDVDFFKFYIRDKDVVKRMASQELEIPVFYTYPQFQKSFQPETDYVLCFVLPVRTFTEDKVLEVELYEREGGRHQRFQIESDIMLKARSL